MDKVTYTNALGYNENGSPQKCTHTNFVEVLNGIYSFCKNRPNVTILPADKFPDIIGWIVFYQEDGMDISECFSITIDNALKTYPSAALRENANKSLNSLVSASNRKNDKKEQKMNTVNYFPNGFPTKDMSQLVDNDDELTRDLKKLPKDDVVYKIEDAVHTCIYNLIGQNIPFTAYDVTRIVKTTGFYGAKHSEVKKIVHDTMKKCMQYVLWDRWVKQIELNSDDFSDIVSVYVYGKLGLDNYDPHYNPNWLDNYKFTEIDLYKVTRNNEYNRNWVNEIQNGWIMPKYYIEDGFAYVVDEKNNIPDDFDDKVKVIEEIEVWSTLDGRIYVPGKFLSKLEYKPYDFFEVELLSGTEVIKPCLCIYHSEECIFSYPERCENFIYLGGTNKDNSLRIPKSVLKHIRSEDGSENKYYVQLEDDKKIVIYN